MKTKYLLSASLFFTGAVLLMPINSNKVWAQTAADESALASISLPQGTLQFAPKEVPHEINDALQTMSDAGGDRVKRGKTEVFGWSGNGYKKSAAAQYKAKVAAALKRAGWEYEEGEKIEGADGFTMISALKTSPVRKALIGFWAPTDDVLVLAWTEMVAANGAAPNGNTGIVPPQKPANQDEEAQDDTNEAEAPHAQPQPAPIAGAKTFEIDDSTYVINVMKGAKPRIPTFPALSPKPGYVRGYVKDSNGKPLKNASLGVRSTAVGGAETSAQGKTDAKGYYEIMVPFGVAGFYNAGYVVEYGEGIAPLGLYPSDGELDDFATPKGYVKNWVLLPYGIADRADLQTNAKYSNNYFGGQVVINFYGPYGMYGDSGNFPEGSTLELTLTPLDPLVDGTKGPSFVFHKVVKEGAEHRFYINNIPLSRYRISGKAMQNGRTLYPLKFQETGPDRYKGFGLAPGDVKDSNELLLRPYNGRVDGVSASHGHWAPIEIDLKH